MKMVTFKFNFRKGARVNCQTVNLKFWVKMVLSNFRGGLGVNCETADLSKSKLAPFHFQEGGGWGCTVKFGTHFWYMATAPCFTEVSRGDLKE